MSKIINQTVNVLNEVGVERLKQNVKFGIQDHSPLMWNAILTEETGEASKEICDSVWCESDKDELHHLKKMRQELIQVAAVAVAFIESLDRNELA